jgi:YbbR domain-containing protein
MIDLFLAIFVRDWPLKIFSLALAVLAWLAVTFSIRNEVVPLTSSRSAAERTFYNVPVVPLSADSDVEHFRVKPAEVDVTVQGDTETLQQLRSSEVRVVADLTGVRLDSTNVLRRVEVVTPPHITHMQTKPEKVEVVPPPAARSKESQR